MVPQKHISLQCLIMQMPPTSTDRLQPWVALWSSSALVILLSPLTM